jgi:hypothetical protein
MKKLRMLFFLGGALLLGVAPLMAQNTVDVLGTGSPQPSNAFGCATPGNPNCIPATFDTSSNSHMGDITAPISPTGVKFYYPADGAQTPVTSSFAAGTICLADSRLFSGPFALEVANCQAGSVLAVLIIRDTAVLTEGAIPVFQISTKDGDFLKNTVGLDPNNVSLYPIRINVASTTPPSNPTGQHNCPNGQAVPAYVGGGTTNYTPNESLCLPAGAGQAVEPSMIVDSQGTIYVESIRGIPGGLDLWRWNKSADGGPKANGTLPFKYEGQPDCGAFVTPACTMSGLAPGGGDGDVAVNGPDSATANIPNLAVVSLAAAEVTASNSINRADSFSNPNPSAAHVPFDDRMWIDALNDPTHVYMEYHDFGTTSQIVVQRSADKGMTYNDATGTVVGPTTDTTTYMSVGPPTGNIAGQIKVDLSNTPSHGNLYQIFVGPDSLADNTVNGTSVAGYINAVYVGVASSPSLAPNTTVLSFTNHKIFSCTAGTNCPTGLGLGNLFPALAVDHFGNVYAVWSDGTDIYYSYSTTHGASWSQAIKVTQVATIAETGHSQAGMSNVFPWVTADADGHVAIAWYGADHAGNSNTIDLGTKWNVYVAETVNGHASMPAFTLSQATDHPNHTGQISTGGLTGNSDRSLADFFQIAIDPTNHLINIAYADNHAGTSVTYFTRQKKATSGITGGCVGHEEDGEGDIRGEKGGDAHFRLHHDDCNEQPDDEEFSDSESGTDFHSTQNTSVTRDDVAHSVTIVGSGVNNGLPVAFTIVAVDSSLVPPGLFSIILSDGYTNRGNLLDGSIVLH